MDIETQDNKKGLIILIIVIATIWIWNNHKTITRLENDNYYLEGELDDCQITLQEANDNSEWQLYDYQMALQEANNNIEEVNSYIEDAQEYAWSSYDEMGWALDNLMTVETVYEP
ncbi:MAG: hypothetical protein Q8N16_02455 [bacterium]|nr:hypothetical protein [bacterium]